ncbi:MAG TPA: type II secretion system F family protein [Tepidisphaeraceae bacterium]|nr:type II secretion system F family protein [Tepidisphaeraceae bacterium]
MYARLLRIAVFTLFWSLLAYLLIMLIASTTDQSVFLNPWIYLVVTVLVLALVASLWLSEGRLAGNIFAQIPPAFDITGRSKRDGLTVLAYVEQALRMNAPLSPMIDAAARTERGRISRRLSDLKDDLDAGMDLSAALEQDVPEVSARAIGLIASAERSGQLRSELTRLLSESDPAAVDLQNDSSFVLAYILMMLIATTFVLTMVVIFIEPKFQDIFHDFHALMPPVNLWMMAIVSNAFPVAGLAALVLILSWFVYGIWAMIRRVHGPHDLRTLLLYLGSYLPWIGASQSDRSWSDVCRVMAGNISAGWPAETALNHLQELTLAPPVRSAVRRWSVQVRNGAPLDEAAHRAALPKIIIGILRNAGDQTAPSLNFLANYYTNRFSRMRILLRGAVVPITVMLFAFCVAVVALGTFLPMINLINSLSGGR